MILGTVSTTARAAQSAHRPRTRVVRRRRARDSAHGETVPTFNITISSSLQVVRRIGVDQPVNHSDEIEGASGPTRIVMWIGYRSGNSGRVSCGTVVRPRGRPAPGRQPPCPIGWRASSRVSCRLFGLRFRSCMRAPIVFCQMPLTSRVVRLSGVRTSAVPTTNLRAAARSLE